jgi:putative phosphoesterase
LFGSLAPPQEPLRELALPKTDEQELIPTVSSQRFLRRVERHVIWNEPMLAFPEARTVAILGDTHGLFRPELAEHLSGIDLIVHSGDVGQVAVLHRLKQYAPVIAVRGNVDDHIDGLPETELISIRGRLIYILHVLANLDLDPAVAGLAMVVSGHSHQPLIRTTKGVLYVNPGSVGPRRFKLPVCFVCAEFGERDIETRLIQLAA